MTTNINLSELNGSQGFVIEGINNLETLGFSVSDAGDLNGDGIDDLVIGAPGGYDVEFTDGRAYVVFGGSNLGNLGSLELSELDGNNGFTINEISFGNYTGFSVSSAGDINGDGIDDLIVGAPFADSIRGYDYEGESYVIFGSSGGFDANINLETLNGNNGFTIGGLRSVDSFGWSVSNAGDVNGDGIEDLIIGAINAGEYNEYGERFRTGDSYVVFGGSEIGDSGNLSLAQLNGSNGFIIEGINFYDQAGSSVSGAGDVNGDGFDDVIIGARDAYEDSTGSGYVVFGASNVGNSGSLQLAQLDGTNGFILTDLDRLDLFGYSVSGAGDVNGDGFDDVIVGAPALNARYDYNNAGKSYVVFGSSNVGKDGSVLLSLLDGSDGFKIPGIDSDDGFGFSVSDAGDVNNDGIDDIIIGAPFANGDSNDSVGESYVIYGSNEGFPVELDDIGFGATLNLADLDDSDGLIITGIDENDRSGTSVSNAGDVNNDGIDDIIVGAPLADANGNERGESYVIFGFAPSELIGTENNDILIGDSGNDTVSGLRGNDTISGLLGADNILGGAGNDLIDGGAGDDTLRGGQNADTISGGIGRDVIRGGVGNDFLRGNFANDTISGNLGADVIWGDFGNDELIGGKGNDLLIGGRGNDDVRGNQGSDRLIGVDTININSDFGIGEIDTLTGGKGDDTYILADENRVFYDDGNDLSSGEDDLAIITTLNTNRDTIQLQGSAELYSLDFFTSDAGTTDARLIYDRGTSAIGEAIAVLEDIDPNLSVADSVFTFV